jgi:hypothetical protein
MTYLPPLPSRTVVSQGAYDAMRGRLRRVATYQRWVLLALLANITIASVAIAAAFQLAEVPANVLHWLGMIRLPICLFMTIAAFLLAKELWNLAIGVLCGLSMWVPYASLLVLLVLNQKATRFLQAYGIKVGLLGADPKRV